MVTVEHKPGASRFEAAVEGGAALLEYRRSGDRVTFVHTEVPEESEGQGIGGSLVRSALAWARAEGLTIHVRCPFVRAFIDRHPELASGLERE
jgi:uncharacterized protein